jgi:cytochrome c peroxidase
MSIVALLRSAGVALGLAATGAGVVPFIHGRPAPSPAQAVFTGQLDSLLGAFDTLAAKIAAGDERGAQEAFRRTRTTYKRSEGMLDLYASDAVTALEGPLEAEASAESMPRPYNMPGLFPMVEEAIFPHVQDAEKELALSRIRAMQERIGILRSLFDRAEVRQVDVFDAARRQIARVSTLDIAGFDSDRQDDALLDAAASLDGVRATLVPVRDSESADAAAAYHRADEALRAAGDYLRQHATFETMDRLTFLSRYSVPASHAVDALRVARGVARTPVYGLWKENVPSVYDSAAFDPRAYAPRWAYQLNTPKVAALGARLFNDPQLSGPKTRACAGCHFPTRAFTDGQPKRIPLDPRATRDPQLSAPRHTPTLLNAALQPMLFADERARGLEQQILFVLADPDEMHSSIDTAVSRVGADSSYRAAFAAAYGAPPEKAVTSLSLRAAIATYIRTLVVMNAPFDRAVRGDDAALAPAARRGFTVFMGKGRCGTCHFAPLFNGTEPPQFKATDPEIIGVPQEAVLKNARLDPDSGRGFIDVVKSHDFAFKVPTVRNAELTGPYMHNGVYHTLDDVIDFYNAGGGTGIGIDLKYQTLFDHPLEMTKDERADLVAFMKALTDTTLIK